MAIVTDFVYNTATDTDSEYKSRHEGETYYFCSLECRDYFNSNPSEIASIPYNLLLYWAHRSRNKII